jgi:hypothetical protein
MTPLGSGEARWAVLDGILWTNDCAKALRVNVQPGHQQPECAGPVAP